MSRRKAISKKVYGITDRVIEDIKKEGFDYREGQVNVMYTVISAFENRGHILIEVGIGIRKSFRYLIPGALISFITRKTYDSSIRKYPIN